MLLFGDNGIISNAQNASIKSGMAALEEYLQEKYVEYYEDSEDYINKPECLAAKIPGLFLKDGTKNYVTTNGKMYYLLNKSMLPKEIQEGLVGGNTLDYGEYIRLQDVYGVTTDLKVYYYDSNGLEGGNALGTLETLEIDPSLPVQLINNNTSLKDNIAEALSEIGITVGEDGITNGNINSIKTLTLDGSKYSITSLSGISELRSLKTLNLLNIKVNDLNGIESCGLLNNIYFNDCEIGDFSKLSSIYSLNKLYLNLSNNINQNISNEQIKKLAKGLEKASNISNLEYFGIFGRYNYLDRTGYDFDEKKGKYSYTLLKFNTTTNNYDFLENLLSNCSDISDLSKINSNVKKSIKYMYLQDLRINDVSCLNDFCAIQELCVANDINLKNLSGMSNKSHLYYLIAQCSGLEDISALSESSNIIDVSIYRSNLMSLNGLKGNSLKNIYAYNCKITNIDALSNMPKVSYLNLENNTFKKEDNTYLYKLSTINALKNCSTLNSLFLAGNDALDETTLSSTEFQTIIKKCGVNYSLDNKYSLLFLNSEKVDFLNYGLTDSQLELLRGNNSIKGIRLGGNPLLSNDKIVDILSTMPNLSCINLKDCSQVTDISFATGLNNLRMLDLRGTSIVDFTKLENMAKNNTLELGALVIDNANIDITKIQNLISKVSSNYSKSSYEFQCGHSNGTRGICLERTSLLKQLVNCTDITSFNLYNCIYGKSQNITSGTIADLSNCSKLKSIQCRGMDGVSFKIPNSCISLKTENDVNQDVSNCTNLTTFSQSYGDLNLTNTINSLSNALKLNSISCSQSSVGNAVGLDGLANTSVSEINISYSNVESITATKNIPSIYTFSMSNCSNYSGSILFASKLNGLQRIYLNDSGKLNSLEGLENNLSLNYINAGNCSINSLLPLLNDTNLTDIYVNGNKVSSLNGVQNLKKLVNLNLADNSISDLYYLELLLNNLDSEKFTCNIDLSNNLLQDTSVIKITDAEGNNVNKVIDNVAIIQRLSDKGCTVNVKENAFNESTISRLNNMKGVIAQ